jgi:hypothetical protein
MILRVCAALMSCVLALACGCAQTNAAIAAKPTTDELFQLKEKETPVQATVAVEDRNRQSTVRLVPDFKPPKLTAEEQAALGEPPLTFKFMPYPNRVPPTGSHVGPWFGGVVTSSEGRGGPSTHVDAPVSVSGAVGWGGVATWIDAFTSGVASPGSSRTPVGVAGPAAAITVEADPAASTVAKAKTHIEK